VSTPERCTFCGRFVPKREAVTRTDSWDRPLYEPPRQVVLCTRCDEKRDKERWK